MGLIASAFLALALVIHLRGGDSSTFLMSVCMRVGFLLGALWLALPQLSQISQRTPPWFAGGVLLLGLVIAVRPKSVVFVLPILAAMALLHFWGWLFKPLPNAKRKPSRTEQD